MNSRRKKILVTVILAISIILASGAFISLRLRGGTRITPSLDMVPDTDVIYYRQDDPKWADEFLGDSKYTLKSSGCLVSCIASSLSMEQAAGWICLRIFLRM